jgi:hypothetical protein
MSDNDLTELMSRVEWMKMDDVDPNDYENFGVRNSRIYRDKFYRLLRASKMEKNESKWLIFMTCLLPSKKRLLDATRKRETAPRHPKANKSINERMRQHTSQEAADPSNHSIVHCPNAFPFYAAHAWALVKPDAQRTVEAFLENTWAAQIWLDPDMLALQKTYEMHFWNDLVKKGSGKYEQGFKDEYWKTKSTDAYPLILENGDKLETTSNTGYTKKDLQAYLGTYSRAEKAEKERFKKQERRAAKKAEKRRVRAHWTQEDYNIYAANKAARRSERQEREMQGATAAQSESEDSEDDYESNRGTEEYP